MPPSQINNKFKLNAARSKNNKFKLNAALSEEKTGPRGKPDNSLARSSTSWG